MLLEFHVPPPPLDRFVEMVTYYSGYNPDHSKERLLPDGAVEIIIDLTDSPKRLYDRTDPDRSTAFRNAWISGMRSRWIIIEAAPQSSMAVIRFRPGGAYRILGFSIHAITDEVDELEAVLGQITDGLRERILEAPTVQARMAVIDQWLAERARGECETHPIVEYVSGRLFAPAGIQVRQVVEEIGYTQRYLLKLFQRWVGMSPKAYARVRRFQQVLGRVSAPLAADPVQAAHLQLPSPPEPDWAQMAAHCGYYDQSHLIHEFRELSGMTPASYVAAYRGLENYLPMD